MSESSHPIIANLSDILDADAEFIPLLSQEDEDQMNSEDIPEILPILPLRNTVLFPGVVIPITVGRDKSINLIREYYRSTKIIGVVAQKDAEIEEPAFEDLNRVGTVAMILKTFQMPDGSTTAIIQGKKRFSIEEPLQTEPYFKAKVSQYGNVETIKQTKKFDALIASLRDLSIQIINNSPNIPSEAAFVIKNIESPVFLVNFVSANLNSDNTEKQKLLELTNIESHANQALAALTKELQMLDLKNQIQKKVKIDIDKQQRDYFLNQQLKTIQAELGFGQSEEELLEMREKAKTKKWSKEVAAVFNKEFTKLQRMNSAAMEYSMQMNYLDTLIELPWNDFTEDNFNLQHAQRILDEDHYGLEKVKERIIEYLAVIKLKGDMKSPILCLLGPPGVGKTSLGKSIARAVGRKYIRMSLGGLRDEAEIRGHRKTYIGAMPGRIIQSLKKIKSSNPVFVLDEVDKVIGANINGDPASALLEVLDPEQNSTFYDNYLEIEYDLSRVMFIATCNSLSTVHPALRDRMEIIDLSGYLVEEKVEIAQRHLIPKQLNEHGLEKKQLTFPQNILEKIIDEYTREAGVRTLEKNIAKIIRNKARFIVSEEPYNKKINSKDLESVLGIPQYQHEKNFSGDIAGVATGLAWTAAGGEILFIEVSLSKGKGNLTLTGNLGDVMKESATLAFEYLKANAIKLNIPQSAFDNWNVHIHVPEGATPKDGPSAGITMFTALASAFTQRKVKQGIAMTGEITLRGKVLPVGGIKEKILAAKRAKCPVILLSKENRKEIEEIKSTYKEGLTFFYINEMIEAIDLSLSHEQVKDAKIIE
ncbi:MAG: endopeptidase La [Lentimicrobiaceae bacterium]|nr:endopeptidase La [Lentimicrobiaceae bacterium]